MYINMVAQEVKCPFYVECIECHVGIIYSTVLMWQMESGKN